MSTSSSSRLVGIRAKIERAKQHINELGSHALAFSKGNANSLVPEDDPQTGEKLYRIQFRTPLPAVVPLVIGDVTHNLRSTLDHLAWQLVEANGGTPGPKTGYPLSTTAAAYNKAVTEKGVVDGASPAVLPLIEATQPYQGGYDGLGALRELNNFDKHRLLIVAAVGPSRLGCNDRIPHPVPADVSIITVFTPRLLNGLPILEDGDLLARVRPEFKEYVQPVLVPEIAFREPGVVGGKPVLPFLADLAQLVERVVNQFVPFL